MTKLENGYQDTEIGQFPMEWDIAPLGAKYHIQQGKALSRNSSRSGSIRMPFLRTSNVYWGRLELDKLDVMEFSESDRERLRLRCGDLLICEGGDIGRTAIWNGELENCYYQNHLFRVRLREADVVPVFHMYWMQAAMTLMGLYRDAGNRTTIPNLSQSRLSSFLIPVPPLPEQRRIAAVLNTIQDAIAAQEDVIAAAKEFKRSLMHRLFTVGPGREPAPTKETEYGEIPAHWEFVPIATIADLQYGYQTSIPKTPPPSGVEIISTAEIRNEGLLDVSKIRTVAINPGLVGRYQVRMNDILFNWRNSQEHVGKTALVGFEPQSAMIFASFIVRVRPVPSVGYRYLHYLLSYLRSIGVFFTLSRRAVNQANFNASHLGSLLVPIPDLPEQTAIEDLLSASDVKIAAEEDRLSALQALFKSMLHQLMTGQIRLLSDEGLPLA